MNPASSDVIRSVEAVWRIEAARVVATLSRYAGDVGVGEDLAQGALLAALEQWPNTGIPDVPGAWLVTVGKRRLLDDVRRRAIFDSKRDELVRQAHGGQRRAEIEQEHMDEDIADDLLRLIFTTCHPVLSRQARTALTLKLVAGLTTEEIARAYLVEVPTMAQRIVRAKRTLAEARVHFDAPMPEELPSRLDAVLEVVYLIFNEGYVATSGERWTRPELCREALRLGRILAELVPAEPEVHGLVALMEIQSSRLRARVGSGGEPILLQDQDRRNWDQLLIRRGLAALERADRLGRGLGPYGLQAAIAACHARAPDLKSTDWTRISALYDALAALAPSPVVDLNRAVALSMAYGPEAGLEMLDRITAEPALKNHHLTAAVRGDLLERLGRPEEARREYERAASLTENERERELLARRARLSG